MTTRYAALMLNGTMHRVTFTADADNLLTRAGEAVSSVVQRDMRVIASPIPGVHAAISNTAPHMQLVVTLHKGTLS